MTQRKRELKKKRYAWRCAKLNGTSGVINHFVYVELETMQKVFRNFNNGLTIPE